MKLHNPINQNAKFSASSQNYALWLWKGDYWNLYSGAENGYPKTPQWWATGFHAGMKNPNPEVMVSVGSIDFTGREALYEGLKDAMGMSKYIETKRYLLFDDGTHTVWILYDEGVTK